MRALLRIPGPVNVTKACAALIAVAMGLGALLIDGSVTAGSCTFKYGGCGFPIAYESDDGVTTVSNAGLCAALCGGRVHCSPSSPLSKYDCEYAY